MIEEYNKLATVFARLVIICNGFVTLITEERDLDKWVKCYSPVNHYFEPQIVCKKKKSTNSIFVKEFFI